MNVKYKQKVFADCQILRRWYIYTEVKRTYKQTVCHNIKKDNYYFTEKQPPDMIKFGR